MKLAMPSCLVLSSSICYVRNKAMSTFRESFNLLGSSFDSLSVLRNLRVLPKAGSLDFEGWQAKRVSNCAACMPVCVRACVRFVRACACASTGLRGKRGVPLGGSRGLVISPLNPKEGKRAVESFRHSVLFCWSKVVCYQPCERSSVSKSVTSPLPSWHNMAN